MVTFFEAKALKSKHTQYNFGLRDFMGLVKYNLNLNVNKPRIVDHKHIFQGCLQD